MNPPPGSYKSAKVLLNRLKTVAPLNKMFLPRSSCTLWRMFLCYVIVQSWGSHLVLCLSFTIFYMNFFVCTICYRNRNHLKTSFTRILTVSSRQIRILWLNYMMELPTMGIILDKIKNHYFPESIAEWVLNFKYILH